MEQASVIRAAIVIALAALLDAVVVPYLTFGFFSPRLTLIAVVFAVAPLRDLQAVLLGFFGGILLDAFGSDLFGVGALAGLGVPQLGEYAVGGVLPDAVINALLAFLIGGWLLNVVNIKPPHSWEK